MKEKEVVINCLGYAVDEKEQATAVRREQQRDARGGRGCLGRVSTVARKGERGRELVAQAEV